MSTNDYTGKVVLTHGAVHYQKPAQQSELCRKCPTGCKTDCLRSNVSGVELGTEDSLFDVDFDSLELDMYDDFDAVY